MRRPLVALFVPSLAGGGAERNMARLASGLAGLGYEAELVVASAEGPHRAEVAPATIVDLRARRVASALPGLVRYLRRRHPAALISSHEHGNMVAVIARRLAGTRVPVIATLRSTLSEQARLAPGWRDRLLLPGMGRVLYPSAEVIIALSHGAAVDAEAWLGLAPGTVRVIANPVIDASFHERAAARIDHPLLASGRPLILAAGRLTPEKDYPTLLEAFARLRRTGSEASLVIIGEGRERAALEHQAKALGIGGDVALPGHVPNPAAWMARARVFALSSRYEGLPTVLIEAVAAGASVVATDCRSGPREILDGGRLGHLVPVGDAAGFAHALEKALREPAPVATPADLARYTAEEVLASWVSVLGEVGVPAP